ncbi:MAG: hypothetical protein LH477_16985 [Nocardioides sp.]|nr:hypothetical protein [Nocardioides sp.]
MLSLLAGCSDASVQGEGSGSGGAASCVLTVSVDGQDWSALSMSKPMARELVNTKIMGTIPDCTDFSSPGAAANAHDGRPVTLQPIKGFPADEVLFLPGEDLDDQLFVPGVGPEVTVDSLPADVKQLLLGG